METKRKPKLERGVTPVGVAVFPKLNEPDAKFAKNGIGKYSVKLRLAAEQAAPLIAHITELAEKKLAEVKAEMTAEKKHKDLAKLKLADNKGYEKELDDTGNETGNIVINFSMPEKVVIEGKPDLILKPAIFDARGEPMTAEVWGGTKLKVAYELRPFYTGALGVGVSLRLCAVQVIDLVTKGMRTSDYFGFDKQEGTMTAPDAPTTDAGEKDVEGSEGDF